MITDFLTPPNVAAAPAHSRAFRTVSVWAEEAVFGHRLWYRQTPWLLFLEFLNVAEAFHRQGKLFAPAEAGDLHPYSLRYRMALRNVLFNNDHLARFADPQLNDADAWDGWITEMAREADGDGGVDFGFLRSAFPTFRDFVDLVTLVRQTTLEASTNRRWSSRFVFPFGVDALFSDAIVKTGQPGRDFNNFGRTGEILYMMLSRADQVHLLKTHFEEFFDASRPKNKLVARLNGPRDSQADQAQAGETFLPYRRHPTFNRLAEDWLKVLELGLPEQDAYAHLVPLGALHILLYQLETAAALANQERPSLVCEMITPRREFVRQRAVASFQGNDALSRIALEAYIQRFLESPAWCDNVLAAGLSEAERLNRAEEMLAAHFSYEERRPRPQTLSELLNTFRDDVDTHHASSCGQVHQAYGRHIGLVSRRGTNRHRYAPTDSLLKTLVVTRVPRRVELQKFLQDLYRHYGLVFGPAEAQAALPARVFDQATFERNKERLEARLGSMGLLNRLSDGCAYVENPFGPRGASNIAST